MILDEFDLAAKREGWAIFEADDGPEICRLDEAEDWAPELGFLPRQLDDDSDAWLIVRTGTGEHHSNARKIISEQNPTEWRLINEWYSQHYPEPKD